MVSYKELISKNSSPTYSDLLSTREWHDKRKEILSRDKQECTNCGRTNDVQETKRRIPTEIIDKLKDALGTNSINVISCKDGGYYANFYEDFPCFQVHHKYYILNKNPWEYDCSALVTLCSTCHRLIHEQETIPFYEDERRLKQLDYCECKKCSGTGYLPIYDYYQNGVCFDCDGIGFMLNNSQ